MAPVIHTPVGGFTGTVAGVNFADGVGESDDPAALLYFSGAGYDIRDEVPPAGTPLTAEELARIAEHDARGDSGQTPPSVDNGSQEHDSHEDNGSDEDDSSEENHSREDDGSEENGTDDANDRPHPVQGSKAVWFEYLTKIKPDHGFDLEKVSRKALIEAVEALEAN